MASGEDVNTSLTEGRNVPLDIDDVHMLLQVEQEQIQKRTFTNWINAQLSKSSPSRVENLFVDLRDGVRLLDLLEVMSGQRLKREKGRGLFQQRGNIETALNFLRSKSIKLVNINIPDVIEGKPSIILGLIWTIILHCHIEELANTLSYSSRHSSLESLSSLDSDSGAGTPLRGSPVPCRASPLHHRFRLSAKKALLLWVRDQCKKVGCSISIKDFKTSWRSGVAFLAILCSLRPDLVDLSLAQTRTNLQNLEHAFCIAEQELGIPRLLEPEDIDIRNPDEKSIMTYVAQFLQYSNDLPTPDDDLEGSPSQKAREMTNWLQRAYEQLQEAWDSTERAGYSERYQAFQTFVAWYCEQRRPVLPMLSAMKHSAKLSEEQCTLRKAWDKMEEKLKQCRVDLDVNMPTPLDTLGLWLQKMEVVLSEEDGDLHDHARAARDARDKHEQLKVLLTDMSCHLNTLHTFSNTDEDGCALLPQDKLDEVKRRFTNARVMAKYHGIRLEYREQWHIVYDLLGCLKAKLNTWKGPYSSQESVSCLLQDWQDTVERQGLISTLKAELNKLKETATMCTSKAALAEDSGRVNRQVKEAESEVTLNSEAAEAVKDTLGRVLLTWESYKDCLHLLQVWLGQQSQTQPSTTQTEEVSSDLSKWRSHHAQLNEAGTYLIDLTECSTSYALAEELSRLNMQWADFIKKTKFSVVSQAPSVTPGAQAPQILVQEAGFLLREPVEVNSGTLRSFRKRVQGMIKKMSELDLDSVTASPDCSEEMLQKLKQTLPEVRQSLSTAEQACECLQKGASLLEGRLAELSHWTTEALDVCEHLKEREQRRLHGPHPRAKGLISRGLQLEGQLVTEGQDIQALLESVQKSSSLPFLSASALQKRVKEAVRQSQEAVETLSRLGVKWQGNVNTDQSPPNVTAGAISQPEPQTKTFQQYQPHASPKGASQISPKVLTGIPQKSNASPQVQKQLKVKSQKIVSQPQVPLSGQPGSSNQGEQIKVTQGLASAPLTVQSEPPRKIQCLVQVQSNTENKVHSVTQHQPLPESQPTAQPPLRTTSQQKKSPGPAKIPLHTPSHTHTQAKLLTQTGPPAQAQSNTPQSAVQQGQTQPKSFAPQTSLKQRGQTKTRNHPPAPGQQEVYARAQALARSRLEKAKQHLQGHIQGAITVFSSRAISEEQARRMQETLKMSTVLEEFLKSVEGLRAFCSGTQLRDIELLSLSVRAQWEAACSAIKAFLPDLQSEVKQSQSANMAVLSYEVDTNTQSLTSDLDVKSNVQTCLSAVEPGKCLDALRGLSETLQHSESHHLATTQLKDCEGRLEKVQHQTTSTAPPQDWKIQVKDSTPLREMVVSAAPAQSLVCSQVVIRADSTETKQTPERTIIQTTSGEEDEPSPQEAQRRYNTARSVFQQQLQENRQRLDEQSPSVTTLSLHTQLQDLQALKHQTEALWFEFELQYSQCFQFMEDSCSLESDRAELIQQWRGQNICLQARMKSLEAAVGLIDASDIQISQISEQLNNLAQKPLDITGFSLTDPTSVHADIKLLNERIQREQARLFESSCETDDPGVLKNETEVQSHLPIQHAVQCCKQRLDQLRERHKQTESALNVLEQFLSHLQQVDGELSTAVSSHSTSQALQVASVRQRLHRAGEEAAMLDNLLVEAGLKLALDGKPVSCQDMMSILAKRLEEAETRLISGKKEMEKGVQGREEDERRERAIARKRRALQFGIREVLTALEKQDLKESTLPALQHRLRFLTDMESKLAALHSELQSLQDASAQTSHSDSSIRQLETQWEETHRAVAESREQCVSLIELLKMFQSCRSHLGGIMQKAEQTISEQSSYMGKDNLQRLLTRVTGIKSELSDLGDGVEEFRGVCRQLQSQMRKISDCADAPFENEADALMDRWLDITERTDSYLDNLKIGLALWDKLLVLAGEIETWTTYKLKAFAQTCPFETELEVTAMQEELKAQEDSVERFHSRAAEIQELLQSREPPLELQVIESQLRKRMGEVKELFLETSEVFRDILAAKTQVAAKMAECLSSLQTIQDSLRALSASDRPQLLQKIQSLSVELQTQVEQADAVLQQVVLLASVAGPENLQGLAKDSTRLQECISTARQLIEQKKELAETLSEPAQARDTVPREFQEPQSNDPSLRKTKENQAPKATIKITRDHSRTQDPLHKKSEDFQAVHPPLKKTKELQCSPLKQNKDQEVRDPLLKKNNEQIRDPQLKQSEEVRSETVRFKRTNEFQSKDSTAEEGLVLQSQNPLLKETKEIQAQDPKLKAIHPLQTQPPFPPKAQDKGLEETPGPHQEDLLRETEDFQQLTQTVRDWVRVLQIKIDPLGTGTCGSLAQTEEKLQAALAVLDEKMEGNSRLEELKVKGQRLLVRTGLEGKFRQEILHSLRDTAEQWNMLLQYADQQYRLMQGVVERASAYQLQRQQAQTRLEQLQSQVAELPVLFPWPGLTERQRAVEQARSLLERVQSLAPALSALHAQRRELTQLTKDPSWTDESLTKLENSASALVKQLNEVSCNLDQSVQGEKHCANQLQHCSNTMNSLQKRTQETAEHMCDLESKLQNLKALQQAIDQKGRDLQEVQALTAALLHTCTTEGQTTLSNNVQSLQKQRIALEMTLHKHLSCLENQRISRKSSEHAVEEALQALQQWSQAQQRESQSPPDTVHLIQVTLERGQKLHHTLEEALSHWKVLQGVAGQELMGTLERDSLKTLSDSASHLSDLAQFLKMASGDAKDDSSGRKEPVLPGQHEIRTSETMKEIKEELFHKKPEDRGSSEQSCLHTETKITKITGAHDPLSVTGLGKEHQMHTENSETRKPMLTVVLDTDLTRTNEVLHSAATPGCSLQQCKSVFSQVSLKPESNLKDKEPVSECTDSHRTDLWSAETEQFESPALKKVATIILDADFPVTDVDNHVKDSSLGHETVHTGSTVLYDLSPEVQETTKTDNSFNYNIPNTDNTQGDGSEPSKKVYTIILDIDPFAVKSQRSEVQDPHQGRDPDEFVAPSNSSFSLDTKTQHGRVSSTGSRQDSQQSKTAYSEKGSVESSHVNYLESRNTNSGQTSSSQNTSGPPLYKELSHMNKNKTVQIQHLKTAAQNIPKETGGDAILTNLIELDQQTTNCHQDVLQSNMDVKNNETQKSKPKEIIKHQESMFFSDQKQLKDIETKEARTVNAKEMKQSDENQSKANDSEKRHKANTEKKAPGSKRTKRKKKEDFLKQEDMANATQMKTVDVRPAVSIDSTQGNTVHLKESFITETEHMEAADAIQSEATDPEQAESTVREEEALMDSGKLSATCTIQANTRPQETADVQATKATEKEAVKLTATSVSLAEGPKSKSHIPTQLPGKKNVSAHVVAELNTGKDEDHLDSVQCSQPMEMHGAKKDLHVRNKAARSKDSFAGAWEKESQMDQLSGTSQLRAVVDIITDIQPLLKTNDNTMMKGLPLGDAWYLEPLPTEAGAQLTRTVLRVLSCRYHPAQINPVLMTQQLQEAQCLRQLVMEQVSALSQHDASKYPSSTASQCLEGRWSAALLDASATVQIKEAQLQQVTQYQQETQTIRDTLQSLEIELETLNLDSLGSSALQCEKLQAFLKSMEQMRSLFGELYQISSQVTAHISETEGPVALIVQVHDLQERWRVLKRTADKALRHTSICTTEMSALVQEAKELQEKLQTMQKLITPSHSPQTPMDSQAVIKLTVATSDLVVANEYYQHLLRVSQVLKQGPLGKKELDDVEHVLQNVKSELDLSQEMLSVHTPDTSDQLPTEILKVMQDYLTWAEQTESKIGRRRKLALFPEEARHQVNEMKKLQSEISNRQSKFTCAVKEFREKIVGLSERDTSIMLSLESTLENLHRKIAENCSFAVAEMDVMLHVREKIWAQITKATSWLMSHFEKEYNKDKVSELVNTAPDLKMQLQKHKATLKAADRQATVVETLLDEVKDVALGLSITEGCHLINRLIALQAEVTDVVSHERSVCWELEELLHIHETSVKERAAVRKSLQQISTEIERQRYPVTRESLSTIEPLRHMLMEHQCHVQEIQCCPESQRRELLNIIYDLQNKTRLLDLQAKQYEMYLSCRHRMENSRDVVKDMVPLVTNSSVDLAKRLRLCLALLAEFPLVKTLCQETADKLEVISQNFFPSQLSAERNKMHQTLQSLASWELTLGREIKNLERILVGHLSHPVDHTAMFHCFSRVRQELHHPVCLDPDDNAIDTELRKRWALRRTLESGLRILEACEDDTATESYRETIDLGKRTLQDCTKLTDDLSQAQEALSEYYWTVHGVARFLQQAESSLLNSSTNFKDCMKEKQHTQQSLGSLVEGFQAHMTEIWTRVPPLMCLSIPQTEQLHIQILSHLLVANATLEAQAQMKLDTLHRSIKEQDIHEKEHKEINQIFRNTESKLSAILSQKSTSSGDCTDLLQRAMGLQRELQTMSGRLEKLRESCPGQGCSVPVELTLDHLWRCWAMLLRRVSALKSRLTHREEEWRDITVKMERSSMTLDRLYSELSDQSVENKSMEELQNILTQTEHLLDGTDQESSFLASLQLSISRLQGVSSPQDLKTPTQICLEWRSLQSRCKSLREQGMIVRRATMAEIQERGHVLEELETVRQDIVNVLLLLQTQTESQHLQEVQMELDSQKARMQDILSRVRTRHAQLPPDIEKVQQEIIHSLQKALEQGKSDSLYRLSEQVREVTVGLGWVQTLLQQKNHSFHEAERNLKCAWDKLDLWHSRIAVLESQVQELAEEKPEKAHELMDELMEPLRLYQTVAQQAEQRTTLISKIPACLQEYEDVLKSSTCWLSEAESWLNTPGTYTSPKCLHSHANSFQVVLDEAKRIQTALEAFVPILEEISPVCDTASQEQQLHEALKHITHLQESIIEPLSQLQHAAAEMDAIETEVKAMEKNVSKIRAILSSMDTDTIYPEEHLQHRQVILENIQSMKRTIAEIENCRPGLGLPPEAEKTLTAFLRAEHLLQNIQDLQQLTEEQNSALRLLLGQTVEQRQQCVSPSGVTTEHSLALLFHVNTEQTSMATPNSEEGDEFEEEHEDCHSSSSETLTGSVSEDSEENLTDSEQAGTNTSTVLTASVTKLPVSTEMTSAFSEVDLVTTESAFMTRQSKNEKTMIPLKTEPVAQERTNILSAVSPQALEKDLSLVIEPGLNPVASTKAADSGANEFESVNEEVRPLPKDTGLVSKETGPVTQELKAVAKKAITATKDIRSETKETEALTKEHGSPTKDKSSITMGKETEPQMASTDHIEGSNDKVIVEDHTAPPAQGHNHQMFCPETSLEQSVTTISAPTLVFSPLDTDIVLQKDTALEVQSELKEQRDLIKAIAHHGSSSDLEQEEHSSSHSPSGFYSATLRFPNLPKEGTTTRETWTKLLTRLEKLQEMIQSEQHKAPFGVQVVAEDRMEGDITSHVTQDMHRHVEQLQHVCLKAGCKGTQVIMQERSHADLSEELCEVLSKITHSLDMVTHIFPTLSDMSREENQLLLLNLECLLAELVAVSSELQTLESVVAQDLGSETPKASACLKCLQNCLSTVQIGLSSRWDELSKHLGQTAQLQTRMQLLESPISVLNESGDENQSFIRNLPKLWGVPGRQWSSFCGRQGALEQCVELQSSSKSLCWGLVGLLELGSERLRKSPMAEVNSRAQLHTVLSGHKRYFKRLAKHFAMVQDLSQQLPEGVLQQLIDIEKQLSDIQKEAVEQGTQMQLNLQEWSEVEDVCGKLTRCLDEVEMGIPNETWEREPESQTKDRLKTCQKLKEVLQETRLQVGVLLDRGRVLQDRGCCCRGHGPADTGSVLMQRCLALQTRLDQEIWAAEKIRESYDRFQSDSVALEEWTGTARERVHMWKYQPAISSQDSKLLFTQIMDFFREMEVWSVQKASISATASQVLQLMDGQAPELRRRLTLLEQTWADLTAVLPSAHDTLQQLLAGMTQREVMSDLNVWVSHMEGRLKEEKNKFQYVQNSTELTQHLQNLKDCKAEMTIRQCCLDFLNQSVDEPGDMEDLTNRDERILLAEDQGALNLSWILLQREIDSQVCHVEQLLQDCKDRDNRLLRLRTWVSGQTERLKAFERPQSHTQLEQALKECEEVKEKVKLKSAELLELRELHLFGQVDAEHPGDQGFFTQVDATIEECTALKQQMCVLRNKLPELLCQWIQFETVVRDAALQTTRISYMLEHGRRPNLSLQQSIDHLEQLEALRAESEKAGEVWTKLPDLPPDLKNKIDSGTALLLSEHLEAQRTRWKGLVHDVELGMFRAQTVLQLWQEYGGLFKDCTRHLDLLWGRCRELLNPNPTPVDTTETIQTKTEAISALQDDIDALQNSVGEVLAASKQLIGQMEPCAAALIQSETRLLSRDVMHLSQILAGKKAVLQEELGEHLNFRGSLESVEQHLDNFESNGSQSASMETLKVGLLELSAQTAELGALNELSLRLKLSNEERERLQTLNAQWVQVFSQATEKHREMYAEWLCAQSFLQKCQGWVEILDKIEHDLAKDISGNFQAVFRQLALHQRLKMEVLISQQLLDAVVSKSLCLLEAGQVEDRSALILGLAQLKERWQGTLQKVQQRGTHLEGLVRQWRLYNTGLHRLQRLLRYSDSLLPPAGLGLCSFQQLQCSIQDFQWAQEQLSLHEGLFTQTLQAGKQIFPWADVQMRSQLQGELSCLQENWEHCCRLMVQRKDLADSVIQKWNLCQTELEDSTVRMGEIKARLKQPLPEILEELQVQENFTKEDEASLACWAGGLRELATMKADISQYVLAGDTALLQEQVEALHDQWEELCLKVSLRKQEIADRLNAWIIFNEKNRELCEWLAQMENKVAHSSEHLSIEDMVEKLKKDCMEEINLFSENKSHLKQLGEQLLLASDRTKQAEVHGALRDVNDRWQHLFDHIETRVKKLKETLVTVQQLDKNMSNLRTWLSRVETELTKPVLYTVCHNDEIQRRLAEQQELQWDIEQHTEGVGSVLTLCEVLLHDEDACGSDVENDSLQQTSRSLDQRWRNICAMSLERRMRIEETWRLWCKFLDDYSHFEDWLNLAERTVADPNSSDVLYTVAKEELKRFEGFQRQVHERLTQLEIINNQYRRLARENRTDTANKLKTMVQKANQRWDNLQRRVAAILRRLRHFTCQREEFEGTRESLLVWLTEMDLQLTNVEHFSETDINDKMKRLNGFKKEITRNTMKIDALIVFGESLIQRSAPLDAALIEDELEELHSYCQEVFGRVARFHQRLTSPRLVLLEEPEVYSRDQTVELKGSEPTASGQDTPPTQPSMCLLAPPQERSGRETPVSVDSIPLEWDHTGDVGGSSSHDEDEEATYYSALSDVEITENPESFVKSTSRTLGVPLVSGRVITEAQSWHSPDTPMRKSLLDMSDGERASPTRTSTPYKQGYVRLMSECSGSIESVKRVSLILEDEDQREEQGLTGLNTADTQSGVLERWELLQAQALSQEQSCSRDPQQMTSDLQDINTWLGRVTPELEKLQKPETSVSVRIMEAKVRQLKEMQKAFAHYKTLMLSLNLGSRDLQQAKNPESQELQESMRNMNRGWTEACAGLESWEDSLRLTLMRCQEFHEALHSLLLWLAHAESRCYTVNILEPAVQDHTLVEHRSMLKGLEEELQSRQRQMSSLQEIAAGLLPEAGGEGSTEAKEKLHVIRNKLRLLLRRVSQDLQTVQERLESTTESSSQGLTASPPAKKPSAEATVGRRTSGSTRENHESSAQRSFFYRVLRAAFPLHLLFLLLLVLACLVPLSEDDYSCTLSNNFARSFYPMLRYTNGPPPT